MNEKIYDLTLEYRELLLNAKKNNEMVCRYCNNCSIKNEINNGVIDSINMKCYAYNIVHPVHGYRDHITIIDMKEKNKNLTCKKFEWMNMEAL